MIPPVFGPRDLFVPRLKIGLFTSVEVGAVSALLIGRDWLMVLLVALGFLVEHIVSFNAKRRPYGGVFDVRDAPLVEIGVVAAVEAVTWIAWLRLVENGSAVQAGAVLVGGLLLGHVLERNLSAGNPLLRDVTRRIKESWDFTILEAATAVGWLVLLDVHGLLAASALAFGLFAEHVISFRRPVRK